MARKPAPPQSRGTPLCYNQLQLEAEDPDVHAVVECERPKTHRGEHHGHTFDAKGNWLKLTWEIVPTQGGGS